MGNKLILSVVLFLLVSLFSGFSICWFLYFLVSLQFGSISPAQQNIDP